MLYQKRVKGTLSIQMMVILALVLIVVLVLTTLFAGRFAAFQKGTDHLASQGQHVCSREGMCLREADLDSCQGILQDNYIDCPLPSRCCII